MTERNAEPELVSLAILDVCERAAREFPADYDSPRDEDSQLMAGSVKNWQSRIKVRAGSLGSSTVPGGDPHRRGGSRGGAPTARPSRFAESDAGSHDSHCEILATFGRLFSLSLFAGTWNCHG